MNEWLGIWEVIPHYYPRGEGPQNALRKHLGNVDVVYSFKQAERASPQELFGRIPAYVRHNEDVLSQIRTAAQSLQLYKE
ncbi:MAG: hypothetical protein V1725_00300 [archaeon]